MTIAYTRTSVNQSGADTTVLLAANASDVARLWYLVGTITANGTLKVEGTNGELLVGAFEITADTLITIGPFANKELCPNPADGVGIQIVSTGGGFKGYAVVSAGNP